MKNTILVLFIAFAFTSCTQSPAEQTSAALKRTPVPVVVTTATATRETFNVELLCNGVLEAKRVAQIPFEQQGQLAEVMVANGSLVQRGDVLGRIESSAQQLALDRAKLSIQRAKVEMQDFLYSYSSNPDTSKLSASVMQTARIKSGMAEAELSLREAEYNLAKTVIRSPYSGRVIDLKAQANNPTSAYEYFCRVVDESVLRVVFSVLESELGVASVGTAVTVYPMSAPEQTHKGVITEVNRMVDNTGMVQMVAELSSPSSKLIPGMNLRVLVQKPIANALVIPIEALTVRQNRSVVFTMVDSLAIWNYVTLGLRNQHKVIITEGLQEGQRVIVSGNATIGHEAWVTE